MHQQKKVYCITKTTLFFFLLIAFSSSSHSKDTTFLVHHLKPFSYEQDAEFKGFAVDIVREMAKTEGINVNFLTVPFKRGLTEVQQGNHQALFIVAKRPERQDTVKWVGPLITSSVYFYTKQGVALDIASIDDIRDNATVGVALGNADHTYLESQGFKNLVVAYSQVKSVELLLKERFDVTPASDIVMSFAIKELGIAPDNITKTNIKLYDSTLYLAFSIDTSDEDIAMWQRSFNTIKASGTYQKIYDRYFQ